MMRVPRVYQNTSIVVGNALALSTTASHHLAKVLRLAIDHPVILFNGDGYDYKAIITTIGKTISVNVTEKVFNSCESPLQIHLGQVISRGDKMDFTIQKAIELGVTAITPLFATRCNVKLDPERQNKKLTHWQGIIESACEQSGRSIVPVCHSLQTVFDWVNTVKADLKIILDPNGAIQLKQLTLQQPTSIAILIGSEGGLTSEEIQQAITYDFTSICLGTRILRTETAGLAICAVLQAMFGDFN